MRFDSPETKAVRFHRPVRVKELAVLRVVSLVVLPTIPNYILLRPISTQEKFPRTENFLKISLLKLENFQLQNFFPTENLCQPITFYKFFFLRKIFLSGNGRLFIKELYSVILLLVDYLLV